MIKETIERTILGIIGVSLLFALFNSVNANRTMINNQSSSYTISPTPTDNGSYGGGGGDSDGRSYTISRGSSSSASNENGFIPWISSGMDKLIGNINNIILSCYYSIVNIIISIPRLLLIILLFTVIVIILITMTLLMYYREFGD